MTAEQREKLGRGLGLFDFDGTLIAWDTQVLFANHVLRREPMRRFYLPLFAAFVPCYRILGDEGLKRVFLSYLWRTEPGQLDEWVRGFVAEWVPAQCFPELLDRLAAHREAGQLTVLASASPEFYVREVGRVLGFDLALGTPVEVGQRMRLFPDLENHKGEAKVRRLSGIIGAPRGGVWPGSHGYTDSRADLPMMRCCGRGTVVNPSPALEAIAHESGWDIVRPPRPWRSPAGRNRQILRFLAGI